VYLFDRAMPAELVVTPFLDMTPRVWHVEGHYFCLTGISSGSNRAVRTFLGLADYRFGFKVLLKPEDPAFPTDPRLFEPTEGSKRIVQVQVVE
jgi:hypothetical protein